MFGPKPREDSCMVFGEETFFFRSKKSLISIDQCVILMDKTSVTKVKISEKQLYIKDKFYDETEKIKELKH